MTDWVIDIRGPKGVEHIKVLDKSVQDYRSFYSIPAEVSDYQVALFLAYDSRFHND